MRLIDADALANKLETFMEWENASFVQKCIDEAPTIEAEPVKHGRLVPMYELTSEGILPDEPMGYMCDQCKAKRRKRLNYCSGCGAKMDGNEQREYEMASDERDYCERYEPTYNPDDGSM